MKQNNATGLQGLLETLPTEKLDSMLLEELEQEDVDPHAVQMLMKTLREREADQPLEMNDQIQAAWDRFQERVKHPPRERNGGAVKAATVLTVLVLLLTLPQNAQAQSLFQRFAAWTDSIFELLSPGDSREAPEEYRFQTDHPGLQELYDTVTDQGVTIPVVPMYLDQSYELTECKVTETASKKYIVASFVDGSRRFAFQLDVYLENESYSYYKDKSNLKTYEINGVVYNVVHNNGLWTAVMTNENLECTIAMDCPEDEFLHVLESIYTMEAE